mgnify:CR=1 FL=1
MAKFLMLTRLTGQGRKTIKDNPQRIKEVNKEVEAMGARIVAQYFLLGPYDFATILEAPDEWNVARVAIHLGARGTLEPMTMPAMDVDQLITYLEAMKGRESS